jgi:hypothetical protein
MNAAAVGLGVAVAESQLRVAVIVKGQRAEMMLDAGKGLRIRNVLYGRDDVIDLFGGPLPVHFS